MEADQLNVKDELARLTNIEKCMQQYLKEVKAMDPDFLRDKIDKLYGMIETKYVCTVEEVLQEVKELREQTGMRYRHNDVGKYVEEYKGRACKAAAKHKVPSRSCGLLGRSVEPAFLGAKGVDDLLEECLDNGEGGGY